MPAVRFLSRQGCLSHKGFRGWEPLPQSFCRSRICYAPWVLAARFLSRRDASPTRFSSSASPMEGEGGNMGGLVSLLSPEVTYFRAYDEVRV